MAIEEQFRGAKGAHERFQAKLRELEDDLAGLRGARERMVAAGVRFKAEFDDLAEETTSRTSDDGLATVTCDGQGEVRD
ncbi:MAG: hypothetical protein ACRDXX_14710, partial [Stackebrandtia sp.]